MLNNESGCFRLDENAGANFSFVQMVEVTFVFLSKKRGRNKNKAPGKNKYIQSTKKKK